MSARLPPFSALTFLPAATSAQDKPLKEPKVFGVVHPVDRSVAIRGE